MHYSSRLINPLFRFNFFRVGLNADDVAEGGASDQRAYQLSEWIEWTRAPPAHHQAHVALIRSYNGSDLTSGRASRASYCDPTPAI